MYLNKYIVALFFMFVICTDKIHTAKILFATCIPSISHQKPFREIYKELSIRGHEVHVLTPMPLSDPSLTNLTEYNIGAAARQSKDSSIARDRKLWEKPDFLTVFLKDRVVTQMFSRYYENILKLNETQELLNKNIKFDLVVVEWLYPTMAALGAYYKCPMIGITSLGAPIPALDTVGNPSHPVVFPDHNLPVTRDMPFTERLMSGLWSVYVRLYYHFVILPREDKIAKRYLGQDLPYLGDIEKNVSLLLLNRNPVFHRAVPMVPAVIELGGIKFKSDQKLDQELLEFLDNSPKDVIYLSFGTTVTPSTLPERSLDIFKSVFRKLPFNIIWKYDADEMKGKPSNVLIRKWVPQVALLEHPKVKLFLTQGGLQSSEEAIMSHKPIIGFPAHSDQTSNVDTFVKYGAGILLDIEDMTVQKLNSSIFEVISDPSYTNNVKKLSQLMYDRPRDGLQRAFWWIEYVIRHGGAQHLKSLSVDMPLWKYFMLDIGAVFVGLFVMFFMFLRQLFKLLRCIVRRSLGSVRYRIKKD